MNLYNEIKALISLKQEGNFWDFKKEWHSNNSDLLHDIICMSNNLVNKDSDDDGYVYYLFSQTDSRPHWVDYKMMFNELLNNSNL